MGWGVGRGKQCRSAAVCCECLPLWAALGLHDKEARWSLDARRGNVTARPEAGSGPTDGAWAGASCQVGLGGWWLLRSYSPLVGRPRLDLGLDVYSPIRVYACA